MSKSTGHLPKKRILLICAVVFVLLCAAAIPLNQYRVRITMTGGSKIEAPVGKPFVDPGVKAVYHGTTLFFLRGETKITTEGTVDTSKLGSQTLTYTASYRGSTAKAVRTIEIVDKEKPVIKLVESPDAYTLPNHPYEEEGFTATDNFDGDLTDKVTSEEKDGIVTYRVKDSSGNEAEASRKIVYDDRKPPAINLTGGETLTIPLGSTYSDSFTAEDDGDGDVTENVAVEGTVDTSVEGTYTLTYTVSDSYKNEAKVTRTVIVKKIMSEAEGNKLIYLTFDDGPGPYTDRLLEILAKYNVKATFFVTGTNGKYQDCMAREAAAGHTVAVHTNSHDYASIYASDEAFWQDYDTINQIILAQTGKQNNLMRFPGGSSNTVSRKYSDGIMTRLTQQAEARGLTYCDWNVSSGDAGGTRDSKQVAANIIEGVQGHNTSVVLCHDIHEYTVDAMEETIQWCLDNGYTFAPMTDSSFPAHQGVNN